MDIWAPCYTGSQHKYTEILKSVTEATCPVLPQANHYHGHIWGLWLQLSVQPAAPTCGRSRPLYLANP